MNLVPIIWRKHLLTLSAMPPVYPSGSRERNKRSPRSIRLIQNYSIGVARIGSALKASVSSYLKVIYIMTSTCAIRWKKIVPHYQPPTYCTISQSLCMERPSYHYYCKAIRLRLNNNMVWFAYKTDVPLGWAVHTVMAGSTQISRNWAVIRYNKIQRLRLSRRSTNRRGSANRTSYSVCPIT